MVNGKSGWKYGDSGKCYTGPDAKKNATKQGLAIDGPDKFKKEEASQRPLSLLELVDEELLTFAYMPKSERDKLSDEDFALPSKRKYPITNQKHLDSAVKLMGKATPSEQKTIKKNIIKIAKKKGLKLPDSWK